MNEKKPGRGRPPKEDAEKLDYFVYVRLRKDQHDLLATIARQQGFATNGGRSAAVRWSLERIRPLVEKKTK